MQWQPQANPTAPHTRVKYWDGIRTILEHSNLQPTVGTRASQPVPLSAQPALSFGANLRTPPDGHTDGQTGR